MLNFRSNIRVEKELVNRKIWNMNIWKIIYLNCGESYEDMIDNVTCHNMTSSQMARAAPVSKRSWV